MYVIAQYLSGNVISGYVANLNGSAVRNWTEALTYGTREEAAEVAERLYNRGLISCWSVVNTLYI